MPKATTIAEAIFLRFISVDFRLLSGNVSIGGVKAAKQFVVGSQKASKLIRQGTVRSQPKRNRYRRKCS